MCLNCGVGEDSWKSLGLQGEQTSQSYRKSTLNILLKTDAEGEAPILWLPDAKSRLIGKDPNGGKDWRQEEKGMTEDEMAGWHHWLNGHEFEWTPGVGDGQGGLACCSSWGPKESDTIEHWTELNWVIHQSHSLAYIWQKPWSKNDNGSQVLIIVLLTMTNIKFSLFSP